MHELILDFVRDAPPPLALARFSLDGGALIACFQGASQGRGSDAPRWIAKTGHDAPARRRLRAEASALGQLEPYATALGVPRLLGWSEATSPGIGDSGEGTACLVQSGVAGRPAGCQWSRRRRWTPLPASLLAASGWLRRFQRLVPAPRATSLAELAEQARLRAEADRRLHPEYAPLLEGILEALSPPIMSCPSRAGAPGPMVAIHGDFWMGNLLLAPRSWRSSPGEVHVVDWSGFDAGTPLDDILTWLGNLDCDGVRRPAGKLERWLQVFFSATGPREFLRGWAASTGFAEPMARLAFYLFLARRMSWELGLGLQARNPAERARAQREWSQILTWLAQHRYPDPFTPMPV